MDTLIILPFLVLPGFGLLALTARLKRMRAVRHNPGLAAGLWGLPGLGYAVWAVKLLVDVTVDPTSHNLWPLEMAMICLLWLGYAAAMWVVLGLWGLLRRSGPGV